MSRTVALPECRELPVGPPGQTRIWRAAKTPETRQVLTGVRTLMDDARVEGGLSSRQYLTPEAQALDRQLGDLIGVEGKGQLHDAELRNACRAVLESYRRCFGSAPVAEAEVWVLGPEGFSPELTAAFALRKEQMDRQVTEARAGRDKVNTALARVDSIERFTWRRG